SYLLADGIALEAKKGRSIMQFDWIDVLIWRLHEPARFACCGGAAEIDAGDFYRLARRQCPGGEPCGDRGDRAPESHPFLDSIPVVVVWFGSNGGVGGAADDSQSAQPRTGGRGDR